jgi:uncharacterized membrane protein
MIILILIVFLKIIYYKYQIYFAEVKLDKLNEVEDLKMESKEFQPGIWSLKFTIALSFFTHIHAPLAKLGGHWQGV